MGNYNCHNHEALSQMMADFAASGIKAKEMPYDEMRWKKAVWNMPFNGMTAAVGATSAGSLIANESMAPIIRQ